MGHEFGVHKLAYFAGMTFHLDTLIMTWLTMAIVILIAVLATRNLKQRPQGWQNFLEMLVGALLEQIEGTMGPKGKKVAPLIITLFLFLVVGNELGLVPGMTSPTSDLNTTLALAVMIVGIVHIFGVMNKGPVRYLKHFFEPYVPFVIINIVEEISKTITLSFRLFGNILAGEILLLILGMLIPYVVPTIWLAFSVFVGVIQALIFTILSISYLSNSFADNQH